MRASVVRSRFWAAAAAQVRNQPQAVATSIRDAVNAHLCQWVVEVTGWGLLSPPKPRRQRSQQQRPLPAPLLGPGRPRAQPRTPAATQSTEVGYTGPFQASDDA